MRWRICSSDCCCISNFKYYLNYMNVFVGLQLLAPITNQKRYETLTSEILQYLQMNREELHIR